MEFETAQMHFFEVRFSPSSPSWLLQLPIVFGTRPDCYPNSPRHYCRQYHRRCMENSVENIRDNIKDRRGYNNANE